MSLIIKGMDMPTRCGKCRLKDLTSGGRWVCRNTINDKAVLVEDYIIDSRHPLCALSETHKPHGRLIDADRLKSMIEKYHCNGCDNYNGARCSACCVDDCFRYIDDIPTIIEAEVSE